MQDKNSFKRKIIELIKPDWKKLLVALIIITMGLVIWVLNPCRYTDEPCGMNEVRYHGDQFFVIEMALFLPYLLVIGLSYSILSGTFNIPHFLVIFIPIAYLHASFIAFAIDKFKRLSEFKWKNVIILLIVSYIIFTIISIPTKVLNTSILIYSLIHLIILISAIILLGVFVISLLGFVTSKLKNENLEFIIMTLLLFITYFLIRIKLFGFVAGIYD